MNALGAIMRETEPGLQVAMKVGKQFTLRHIFTRKMLWEEKNFSRVALAADTLRNN